jgi:putative DNA-invertase from lambdoid prophage Rac
MTTFRPGTNMIDTAVNGMEKQLRRTKAEGKALGRPPKTTPKQRAEMVAKYKQSETVSALARFYGISRATVLANKLRYLFRHK